MDYCRAWPAELLSVENTRHLLSLFGAFLAELICPPRILPLRSGYRIAKRVSDPALCRIALPLVLTCLAVCAQNNIQRDGAPANQPFGAPC